MVRLFRLRAGAVFEAEQAGSGGLSVKKRPEQDQPAAPGDWVVWCRDFCVRMSHREFKRMFEEVNVVPEPDLDTAITDEQIQETTRRVRKAVSRGAAKEKDSARQRNS